MNDLVDPNGNPLSATLQNGSINVTGGGVEEAGTPQAAEIDATSADVRDAPEVDKSGKITGSVNVSRGMLEFRADPDSPFHDKSFSKDKTFILYCASGGRSALAGKVLKDMGYDRVYNLGAFKDWVASCPELPV